MIPKNIYEKYHMNSLENELELFGDNENTRCGWYETFLLQTDFIANKILEGAATSADYADELYYREVARQELDKLNGGTGEVVNAVPLDALLNTMLGVE